MSDFTRHIVCILYAAGLGAATAGAQSLTSAAANKAWTLAVSASVRETFDSNVFLQDVGGIARRSSPVTSAALGLAAGYERTPAFRATLSYTPELVRYHRYDSENHVAHRAAANFSGAFTKTTWEWTNSFLRIDGSDQGPIFDAAAGGDIPAIGGIPLRERREAVVLRNGLKLTHTRGRWMLRPAFTTYSHDFRTDQRARTGAYGGYENYVDRWELNGGADAGYDLGRKTWLVAGYRYGRQQQGRLLGAASPYSNRYSRILLGLEGSPAKWLRLSLSGGPDFRSFQAPPAGFDPGEQLWYIGSSAGWLPSGSDTVTLTLSRYEQPAFSSHSVYEDIVYDVSWRRRHSARLATTLGFRAYGGDWQAPVNREDWIYTPAASLTYSWAGHITTEISYSYDAVRSRVPNTTGREYTRHLLTAGVRFTL
jgi:hypothetical protein